MSKHVVIEEPQISKLRSCAESISPLLSHLTDGRPKEANLPNQGHISRQEDMSHVL